MEQDLKTGNLYKSISDAENDQLEKQMGEWLILELKK